MSMTMKKLLPVIVSAVLAVSATEAAAAKKKSAAPAPAPVESRVYDPLEPINRGIFWFNQGFDRFVFRPVASGYRYITPQPIRNRVGNFTDNLFEPINMLNALLQGDFTQGMTSFWRLLINTTIGLGGINDVASEAGLAARTEDFGQTLGFWGVGDGPYLVIPILGPSNLRDAVGMVADVYTHPLYYYLEADDAIFLAGTRALVVRERLIDPMDDINGSALDAYASYRSIYGQLRAAQIKNTRSGDTTLLDGSQQ